MVKLYLMLSKTNKNSFDNLLDSAGLLHPCHVQLPIPLNVINF